MWSRDRKPPSPPPFHRGMSTNTTSTTSSTLHSGVLSPAPPINVPMSASPRLGTTSPSLSVSQSPGTGAGARGYPTPTLSSSPRTAGFPFPSKQGTGQGTGVSQSSLKTGRGERVEVDKLGYTYSLRIALLHQHLSNPPTPSPHHRASIASTISPPLPSPTLQGTSPKGSRLTFASFSKSQTPPIPSIPDLHQPQPPSPNVMGRRKSSFGLNLRNKDKEDNTKLPKEFLIEFWGTLDAEQGDEGWRMAVRDFLGGIKKGSKTAGGSNLREVTSLLDAFTATIPPPSATSAPTHIHQTHLLQLLYNSLPRSSYFSPVARPQSDKDRDLLFRIRAEVESFMLPSTPNLGEDLPTPMRSPEARRSPSGIGLGRTVSSQNGGTEIRRKPSPVWMGENDLSGMGEMVQTVGDVWGIEREVLEKDVAVIRQSGNLDSLYLTELKASLTGLSALPPPLSPTQRSRQVQLSESLHKILNDFPDLATPGSPKGYTQSPDVQGWFITPPRKVEVFGRLTARATEMLGPRTRDLVERCRDVWGISPKGEREKELDSAIQRWSESIGTREESSLGKIVIQAVADVSAGLRPTDPLPLILENLLTNLLSLLSTSISSIFPSTDLPPPPPPPSLIPILKAGNSFLASTPQAVKVCSDLADELKAGAVGEYVVAVGALMGGFGGEEGTGVIGMRRVGRSGKDKVVEGFEAVAGWIEKEVGNVRRVWAGGLGGKLNPASIILSKQFPLFCAELQAIDKPRGPASDIFGLYETTGRLLETWEELCPGQEHGFEHDAFFEPHVLAWLRDTEEQNTHEWVSRAVGMDSWVPEGENKHSQSVIDLFDFIRGSAKVILHDLPLGEYKRAVYLIDLSKTMSGTVSQYASTVLALFDADMRPAKVSTPTLEIQNKLGGKAGSWLAKGQQAVKNLEKKKVDGFVVPPVACVKLTDMHAAQVCLEDLHYAMEAEETAKIVKAHKLPGAAVEKATRHVFTVTLMRGENLLGKGLNKPADGFVVITDKENGERLLKSKTVLGVEDPRWEQSFEITIASIKTLELTTFDRQLVGKHDLIGTASFKLDPRQFANSPVRDLLLPLSPRGNIHIRISMEGGEKHDVGYHLGSATRALQRAEGDMMRGLVDRMTEFVKSVLGKETLLGLTKPLKDKKRARTALSEGELEASLGPLFEYLNENFSVFSVTLPSQLRLDVMLHLWRSTISTLISLLVPPLSDKPYTTRDPLGPHEVDVVFKWLQLLKNFFNASENGVEHGVPSEILMKGNYRELIMLGQYLDLPTPQLKERAAAAVKSAGRGGGGVVGGLRGLSFNGNGNAEKDGEDNDRMAEVLLRIARTRPDTAEFLGTQIASLTRIRVERQGGLL